MKETWHVTLTYEEELGRVSRWGRRVVRATRWVSRGVLRLPRRILVEIRWRLGDEIMALPIYEALKCAWPDATVGVWCSFPELLEGNPFVDQINTETIKLDRYICLRSGPKDINRLRHYARLARVPVPDTRPRLYYQDWTLPPFAKMDNPGPVVAVSTGASWERKRWPREQWRALCSLLAARGCSVVELGLAGESIGVGLDLCGKTSVRDAACVLHGADLYIGCDSGLLHLARAAGTPVLALFGPTDPSILIQDDPGLHIAYGQCEQLGCWNAIEGMTEMGGCPVNRTSCFENITPAGLAERAMGLLTSTQPGSPGRQERRY